MDINVFFKSLIDSDDAPVVICDTEHTIVYMNPASVRRYERFGGAALVGRSIFDCHNPSSTEKIKMVTGWFMADKSHNSVFTFHSDKENKDVYMKALRDENGELIGYYEKHEFRTLESSERYELKQERKSSWI